MVCHLIVLVTKQIGYLVAVRVFLLQQQILPISTKSSSRWDLRVAGHLIVNTEQENGKSD